MGKAHTVDLLIIIFAISKEVDLNQLVQGGTESLQ
jgi:hypothetical protein